MSRTSLVVLVLAFAWAGSAAGADVAGPEDIAIQDSHRKFTAEYVAAVNSSTSSAYAGWSIRRRSRASRMTIATSSTRCSPVMCDES